MIYKRKTSLKIEEEFMFDVKTRIRAEEIKRRCFKRITTQQNDIKEE